jgi:hypothetical protein
MHNPENLLEVSVRIEVRQPSYGHGNLSLQHNFQIRADGFDDIAKVLLKYDELSKAIQEADSRRGA